MLKRASVPTGASEALSKSTPVDPIEIRRAAVAEAANAVAAAEQAYRTAVNAAVLAGESVESAEVDRARHALDKAKARHERAQDALAAEDSPQTKAARQRADAQARAQRAEIERLATERTKAGREVTALLDRAAPAIRNFYAAHEALWAALPLKVRDQLGRHLPTGELPAAEIELMRLQIVPGWGESSGVPRPEPLAKKCEQYAALIGRLMDGHRP